MVRNDDGISSSCSRWSDDDSVEMDPDGDCN